MQRTPVPEKFQGRVSTASQKQLDWIRDMIEGKNLELLTDNQQNWLAEATKQPDEWWNEETTTLTKKNASKIITVLKDLPKVVSSKADIGVAHEVSQMKVEDGYYAVVDDMNTTDQPLSFFRVKNGHTRIFVDVYASDARYPIKDPAHKLHVLKRIAEDPVGAKRRFGQEIGKCGRCGRTLTDATSRAFGIGPDCREMMGL